MLMSTYAGETVSNLNESLNSIYAQTLLPQQLVLVVDGPVGKEQDEVINVYAADPRIGDVKIVRLPSNAGLARAMNAGMKHCSGEYIMRADSDDICEPERLELQLNYLERHPEIDWVASWVREFSSGGAPDMLKTFPDQNDQIVKAMQWRNVIPHTTVFLRTKALHRVGGYRPGFGLLEDYDLFVRLLTSGAKIYAFPKPLVRMRTSFEQRRRRGGFRYCLNEIRFRYFCFRSGFINLGEFFIITSLYVLFRLIGGSLRNYFYRYVRISEKV